MRAPTITGHAALSERLVAKSQLDASVPESTMPAYMEMFLAHLRLLIGVPFEYLVPDARLLPDESIRFFYLDRSWTDRLVDGALAVGKIGTREQAHHQAHSGDVQSALDLTERVVRQLQRGKKDPPKSIDSAGIVTGFLLRSSAVAGWPSMDVRAFSEVIPESQGDLNNPDQQAWITNANAKQLTTLRLELLSPSVLLALFDGVPELVWCEEPHHGIQFGFNLNGSALTLDRHGPDGATNTAGAEIPVPVRAANPSVIAISALRERLFLDQLSDPKLVPQTGSAALAIELLNYPWRQRFEQSAPESGRPPGKFIADFAVAKSIVDTSIADRVEELFS